MLASPQPAPSCLVPSPRAPEELIRWKGGLSLSLLVACSPYTFMASSPQVLLLLFSSEPG